MTVCWDGTTLARFLERGEIQIRHTLADAARAADWPRVFELLSGRQRREWVNSSRPGGPSWYTPLH